MNEPRAVSSRHNPRYRAAMDLREARQRRSRGQLLVDGAREIGRALDCRVRPVEAWVALDHLRSAEAQALLPRLARSGAEVFETTPELLARLAYGDRDEGVVAIFEAPATDITRLAIPERPLVVVAEGVEKPGNLGAVLRSADGAGVDAVIVSDPVSDVWNPNVVRASLGTIFSLPLAMCSAEDALAFLRGRGVAIVAARVDAVVDYDQVDLVGPVALIVGAEVAGLTDAWSGPDVTAVRIPMLGSADSLNVSVSAAVLLFEAQRQRRAAASR